MNTCLRQPKKKLNVGLKMYFMSYREPWGVIWCIIGIVAWHNIFLLNSIVKT
jgi:hypothetical protein